MVSLALLLVLQQLYFVLLAAPCDHNFSGGSASSLSVAFVRRNRCVSIFAQSMVEGPYPPLRTICLYFCGMDDFFMGKVDRGLLINRVCGILRPYAVFRDSQPNAASFLCERADAPCDCRPVHLDPSPHGPTGVRSGRLFRPRSHP
jgi:hypothetical protein